MQEMQKQEEALRTELLLSEDRSFLVFVLQKQRQMLLAFRFRLFEQVFV